MRNSSRLWTTSVEGLDIPSFQKPLPVVKDFFYIFPEFSLGMLVENSNIYAKEKRYQGWLDITKEELLAYLGMMILISNNPISDSYVGLQMYSIETQLFKKL